MTGRAMDALGDLLGKPITIDVRVGETPAIIGELTLCGVSLQPLENGRMGVYMAFGDPKHFTPVEKNAEYKLEEKEARMRHLEAQKLLLNGEIETLRQEVEEMRDE